MASSTFALRQLNRREARLDLGGKLVTLAGVPVLSQRPIPARGTFTYHFVATPSGSRWYHTHFNETVQQGQGLVAPLIVEPSQPEGKPPGPEYTLVTQYWGPPGRLVEGAR